ncbi:hypothetical protein BUALT_Bualt18G0073700 [Buddleja alternifolia]|uniref:Pectinesterase n=1 Tax=Buddleja alternifolia TaxID=168488 RepID=A0AAV6W3U6_9LAMI|nr:hypothetical protein BUALT_Bualt18G0073700 [Buddleja alternifolia]
MNLSSFSSFFVVLLVLWSETKVTFSQSNIDTRNYITWNDLTVEDKTFHSKDIGNQKKVIVVDKNGGGDSVTVQGAVDMVPQNNAERVKIHIRPGVYSEKVRVPASKPYISFIGDQDRASETVITWHDKASDRDNKGGLVGTWNSYSVIVESNYFCASWITFQNTAGRPPKGANGSQAVALRIAGDKAVFYKVRFLGSQDTLLDEIGTHYFLQCFIQGSVDFIFGNGRSLYKKCTLSVVDGHAIAAQSRTSANEDTGFSFVNCTVGGTGNPFLGRAWGDYSRVIYSNTEFNINVIPQGWDDWGKPSRQNTVVFGEYQCRGRGADRSRRVRWSKGMNYLEAKPFLDESFIRGDLWLRL